MIKLIFNWLKNNCRRVTPAEAISHELVEAEMALLRAETGVEYAQAAVTYNRNRIKRLKAYITAASTNEETKEAV